MMKLIAIMPNRVGKINNRRRKIYDVMGLAYSVLPWAVAAALASSYHQRFVR